MSIATKLFSLKRICQNPRKIVSETFQSNPLRVDRHGYHTSPSRFQQPRTPKIPLPFNRLLHNAAYLKPKPSSNNHPRFISKNLLTFKKLFSDKVSHVRRIAETHGVLIGLIVANVGVHLLWKVADTKFMYQNFTLQLDNLKNGRFHTMITYAFNHKEGYQVLASVICLCLFGKRIGENFGPKILLKLYLAGAFAGSTFFLAHKAFLAQSENKGISKRGPSKDPGMGAIGAAKAVMMFRLIMFLREKIHNKLARANILGLCIVLDEILEIAAAKHRAQKHKGKTSTFSLVFANMGGVAVAVIVGAPILAGGRLRKWRC